MPKSFYHSSNFLTFTCNPPAGLAVNPPLTSTFFSSTDTPSLNSNSKLPTHPANKHANSALANPCPIHALGPCKNDKNPYLLSTPPWALSPNHLSGLNKCASDPQSLEQRLVAHGTMT